MAGKARLKALSRQSNSQGDAPRGSWRRVGAPPPARTARRRPESGKPRRGELKNSGDGFFWHFPGCRLLAVLLAGCIGTVRAEDLSFARAQQLALGEAPTLAAAAARLATARHELRPAGELPDPQLALGVDNLPIEGPGRYRFGDEPMAMRRLAFSQAVPNRTKRAARGAVARGDVAVSAAQAAIDRLTVRQETAQAWIDRHTAERQLARVDALRAENRLFAAAVRARLAGGAAAATDSVAPRREAADIDALQDRFEARREQALADLARVVGEAARAPLAGSVPDWPISRAALLGHLPHHPQLAAYDARQERARADIALARAARRPDWGLAVAYQQRDRQFGDMVSLEFSADLPLFAGRRQEPLIAARVAEREALAAEYDALLREHRAALEAGLAEYRRLGKAVARQRRTLLPLAAEKVALARAAWRGGQGSLGELVAARRERIDAELELIDLEGQHRQTAARLHYAYAADHASAEEQP
jgi:outer membrane protein TolC